MPLTLNQDEHDLLMRLASPVPAERRQAFIRSVCDELEAGGVVGEGAVHRAAARHQLAYWTPPIATSSATAPRHKLVRA